MALASITSVEIASIPSSNAIPSPSYQSNPGESTVNKEVSNSVSFAQPLDTVTLQDKIQKNKPELSSEKKGNDSNNNKSARSVSDVLFVYNAKGALRIKFMDSEQRLIYQTPPVLFARISDLISSPQSAVNTKA